MALEFTNGWSSNFIDKWLNEWPIRWVELNKNSISIWMNISLHFNLIWIIITCFINWIALSFYVELMMEVYECCNSKWNWNGLCTELPTEFHCIKLELNCNICRPSLELNMRLWKNQNSCELELDWNWNYISIRIE